MSHFSWYVLKILARRDRFYDSVMLRLLENVNICCRIDFNPARKQSSAFKSNDQTFETCLLKMWISYFSEDEYRTCLFLHD